MELRCVVRNPRRKITNFIKPTDFTQSPIGNIGGERNQKLGDEGSGQGRFNYSEVTMDIMGKK